MRCREAGPADLDRITALLKANDLRTEGVMQADSRYWVAEVEGRIVGCVGIELGARSVLLRSAVVEPESRSKGIGRCLATEALGWARGEGYGAVYCFSTDAGTYWLRMGFQVCSVDEVVAELAAASQVRLFEDLGWLATEVAFKLPLLETK